MYQYIYDITRYGNVQTTIETSYPLTQKREIMNFYKRVITAADRERIIAAYNMQGFFDGFDYIKDNLIERDPQKEQCQYWELMGDCQFYEGLSEISENRFSVLLGS